MLPRLAVLAVLAALAAIMPVGHGASDKAKTVRYYLLGVNEEYNNKQTATAADLVLDIRILTRVVGAPNLWLAYDPVPKSAGPYDRVVTLMDSAYHFRSTPHLCSQKICKNLINTAKAIWSIERVSIVGDDPNTAMNQKHDLAVRLASPAVSVDFSARWPFDMAWGSSEPKDAKLTKRIEDAIFLKHMHMQDSDDEDDEYSHTAGYTRIMAGAIVLCFVLLFIKTAARRISVRIEYPRKV
ncbi:hypothetical protein MCUN1_003465 [Malassezia cuniculi]|uniref:Protein BIG1 n=1 Tax=Malassezia cuniculi TaxID=948313 RepID=A0AAF0J7G2_9BASI|nr:hypothetical protein MCUN1_003465 [Malassezia cuniculi]